MTDEHKQARLKGIGGSEISAILGINPYSTPYDIWLNKTQGKEIEDNDAMWWGRKDEPNIAELFALKTGFTIVEPEKPYYVKDEIFIASPDRFYKNGTNSLHVLECKSTTKFIEDDAEPSHYAQLQWYLGITDCKSGAVAYRIGHELKTFYYAKDEIYIEAMQTAAIDFWNNHILTGIPPEPTTLGDLNP